VAGAVRGRASRDQRPLLARRRPARRHGRGRVLRRLRQRDRRHSRVRLHAPRVLLPGEGKPAERPEGLLRHVGRQGQQLRLGQAGLDLVRPLLPDPGGVGVDRRRVPAAVRNGRPVVPCAHATGSATVPAPAGMLGAKDGETRSYLEFVDILRQHGAAPKADMHALWRRIVYTVLISNTDDHLRNHGFPVDWPRRMAPVACVRYQPHAHRHPTAHSVYQHRSGRQHSVAEAGARGVAVLRAHSAPST